MRVTNKMLSENFLYDMNNNLQNMRTLQQQLTSGKQIRKPSDDPFKVARSMQLSADIDANTQYNNNIKDTINWLDTTDTSLSQLGDTFQRVRELLISAGNAAYGPSERAAIKDEINQRIGQVSQILNTNFDGKYIFAGTNGTNKPMDTITDANKNTQLVYSKAGGGQLQISIPPSSADSDYNIYNMIGGKLTTEISQGVCVQYNVSANSILQFTAEDGKSYDLRELMTQIVNHLDGKNDDGTAADATATSKLSNQDLTGITDVIDNILSIRSDVGSKQNAMESAQSKNEDENYSMTTILSQTEDIDITQKTMEYANMQTVYTASLQTSAKIIQPSLMDYLR